MRVCPVIIRGSVRAPAVPFQCLQRNIEQYSELFLPYFFLFDELTISLQEFFSTSNKKILAIIEKFYVSNLNL